MRMLIATLAAWSWARPSSSLAAATTASPPLPYRVVQVEMEVDGVVHYINATALDDRTALARKFCDTLYITEPRCVDLVAVEIADALFCTRGARAAAREAAKRERAREHVGMLDHDGGHGRFVPRTFRFVTSPEFEDSEEFELLRPLLTGNGFVECITRAHWQGDEDAVWLLGHLSRSGGGTELPRMRSHMRSNGMPRADLLGEKDALYAHLAALGAAGFGDAALRSVPRTWLAEEIKTTPPPPRTSGADSAFALDAGVSNADAMRWLVKDPRKALGGGISLVRDPWAREAAATAEVAVEAAAVAQGGGDVEPPAATTHDMRLAACDRCVLQRYVTSPLLVAPTGKKFSFGVYAAITSLEPLEVSARGRSDLI